MIQTSHPTWVAEDGVRRLLELESGHRFFKEFRNRNIRGLRSCLWTPMETTWAPNSHIQIADAAESVGQGVEHELQDSTGPMCGPGFTAEDDLWIQQQIDRTAVPAGCLGGNGPNDWLRAKTRFLRNSAWPVNKDSQFVTPRAKNQSDAINTPKSDSEHAREFSGTQTNRNHNNETAYERYKSKPASPNQCIFMARRGHLSRTIPIWSIAFSMI